MLKTKNWGRRLKYIDQKAKVTQKSYDWKLEMCIWKSKTVHFLKRDKKTDTCQGLKNKQKLQML